MIHRLQCGQVPDKPHTAFYRGTELVFEHCFTRKGFDSAYTIMYHRHPPHWIVSEEFLGTHPGAISAQWDGSLRRRHFIASQIPQGNTPFLGRYLLMANADLGIWIVQSTQNEPTLVANADGDELIYVFQGSGHIASPLGMLPFQPEDYVYIPRSLPHQWTMTTPVQLLILEGRSWLDIPVQFRNPSGQLRMDAPYSHRDFKEPLWSEQMIASSHRLIVKKNNDLTAFEMKNNPLDTLGWDGQVWPFTFPIRAFQPKTGLVHLPPTIHTTFSGGGFVVCSFVPRWVDFHEKAIPCPYPHSSVDCDEFLFYIEGNFTSRKGIGPGSMTLHPAGLPHGPHAGTYEASIGSKQTNELAIMVDTFKPLYPTDHARSIEVEGYNRSWMEI